MVTTAAVLGASGYAGGELIRLIDAHPYLELEYMGAHSRAGLRLGEVHPHLSGGDRVLGPIDTTKVPKVDIAFLAMPHGASASPALDLRARGVRVVDLGSDFRLDTAERYQDAYEASHPFPNQLPEWVYGLPELFGDELAEATQVAVPGCYPTSALLILAPLFAASLIEDDGVIVDSMSGVSGAGRGGSEALSFGAIDESVKAYKVLAHRHRPEMEAGIEEFSGRTPSIVFTPHLVPMQRGILTTAYATGSADVTLGDLEEAIDKTYARSQFVRRVEGSPETRWVVGSNNALISMHLDDRTNTVVALCAIDNLIKGAAGQAIQCANIMMGLDEAEGLPDVGWMP
ncbi:MAG: N-acetyl-gamma-glutamyl-phosphate reductase [Acidimicrobiia bacterium]